MTTKKASEIVNTMEQGLKGEALDLAIAKKLDAVTPGWTKKDANAVRNEYVQHTWDVEDLVGDPAPKKKATTTTKEKKPSRTSRMFHHVLSGLSNEAALAAVKNEFGNKIPTNISSIAWVRSQLRAKTKYAEKYNAHHKIVVKANDDCAPKSKK